MLIFGQFPRKMSSHPTNRWLHANAFGKKRRRSWRINITGFRISIMDSFSITWCLPILTSENWPKMTMMMLIRWCLPLVLMVWLRASQISYSTGGGSVSFGLLKCGEKRYGNNCICMVHCGILNGNVLYRKVWFGMAWFGASANSHTSWSGSWENRVQF